MFQAAVWALCVLVDPPFLDDFKGFAPAAYSCKTPAICFSVKRELRTVCCPLRFECFKNKLYF